MKGFHYNYYKKTFINIKNTFHRSLVSVYKSVRFFRPFIQDDHSLINSKNIYSTYLSLVVILKPTLKNISINHFYLTH